MKRALILIASLILLFMFTACAAIHHVVSNTIDISPYSYGLATAKDGIERYQVLLKTHREAVKAGVNVDYTGIDTILLEIPEKPSRIPLTNYNDFKGCVFVIKNNSNRTYLFEKNIVGKTIEIDKQLIDEGDFRSVDSLRYGRCLLVIEDNNPWVANRKGYKYGHIRRDILLLEKGFAKNSVVMPYNNAYSNPQCTFIRLDKEPLVIKNLTIERDSDCSFQTYVTYISGEDDVQFSNVKIRTPESPLTDDRGISIYNCTNVTMSDVQIEGTYSQPNHSGYGIFLNNVWNYNAVRLYGKANWGIFGNNNVNTAMINDSQINRFDIHCYGRDISFRNVDFFDLYNQYSSVYGTIQYDHCTFTDFVPVLNGGSYNAYVAHDIVFKDCVFNASPKKKHLIRMGNLKDVPNERPELTEKCLPNVWIKNLTVNMLDGEDSFVIFFDKIANANASSIGHLKSINIDGLTINSNDEKPIKNIMLSNIEIGTKNAVDCTLNNVVVNIPHREGQGNLSISEPVLKTNIPIKGGKVTMKNVQNLKQL